MKEHFSLKLGGLFLFPWQQSLVAAVLWDTDPFGHTLIEPEQDDELLTLHRKHTAAQQPNQKIIG